MSQPVQPQRAQTFASLEEFLAWESEQVERYEFVDGIAVAMAGASPRHNAIEVNLVAALKTAQGRDSIPLGSGQKIRTYTACGPRSRYADASVACGDRTFDKSTLLNPSVIFEILSRRTEADDRGDKWNEYRKLASLRDYLLVSQRGTLIEHFQRTNDVWAYRTYEAGQSIVLSDGTTIAVDTVYDRCWSLPSDEADTEQSQDLA